MMMTTDRSYIEWNSVYELEAVGRMERVSGSLLE
jgi:hypothetical protein